MANPFLGKCWEVEMKPISINCILLSIEWNLIRLGDPARGIVTKNVHKTLPGLVG